MTRQGCVANFLTSAMMICGEAKNKFEFVNRIGCIRRKMLSIGDHVCVFVRCVWVNNFLYQRVNHIDVIHTTDTGRNQSCLRFRNWTRLLYVPELWSGDCAPFKCCCCSSTAQERLQAVKRVHSSRKSSGAEKKRSKEPDGQEATLRCRCHGHR
jgi:hypothetical protein